MFAWVTCSTSRKSCLPGSAGLPGATRSRSSTTWSVTDCSVVRPEGTSSATRWYASTIDESANDRAGPPDRRPLVESHPRPTCRSRTEQHSEEGEQQRGGQQEDDHALHDGAAGGARLGGELVPGVVEVVF